MEIEQLQQKIKAFLAENRGPLIQDIKTLVDIPSVEAPAEGDAPFGMQVHKALEAALSMAQRMGLTPCNVDNYFGYADLAGESDTQLGIISHIDVVPAGNGWNTDPFSLTEKDGWLLGRGVADDKGPAVLSLYTAKFFAQLGVKLPYTLRILLGTNEESGMRGLTYYLERFAPPAFCFTPDAEFPVCYGEKGNYHGTLESAPLTGNLVSFSGGVAANVVPDRASAVVRADFSSLQPCEGIELCALADGLVRVEGFGKGGHASLPQGTVNAILQVVRYLLKHHLCSEGEAAFLQLQEKILSATDGSTLGLACSDESFTPLTCVGGVVAFQNGVISQSIDIRYPTCTTAEKITAVFTQEATAVGGTYTQVGNAVPFLTSPDTPQVQALIGAYNAVTGKHEKPFTIGGGTYARHFPMAVSFGPEDPSTVLPDFVGPMHGANEGMHIDALLEALHIYIVSVAALMDLPL